MLKQNMCIFGCERGVTMLLVRLSAARENSGPQLSLAPGWVGLHMFILSDKTYDLVILDIVGMFPINSIKKNNEPSTF
jgi:hypothetical protein